MKEFIDSLCIIIASHISAKHRLSYLIDCVESLIKQTTPITIYLSISFENEEIKQDFYDVVKITKIFDEVNICVREHKTPQMLHIYLFYLKIYEKHKWVMFCDDDDTYQVNRVQVFANNIFSNIDNPLLKGKYLAGCYESNFNKDHREHRHEYWCYCVNINVLGKFFYLLQDNIDIISNKCCDVLFSEYLRRLNIDSVFIRIPIQYYNYRIDNNIDSITGNIKENQIKYTRLIAPPSEDSPEFPEYIADWNNYLYKNMDIYLHDVFLRTIIGCDIDFILRSEFKADYLLLSYVDESHILEIKKYHEYWLSICNKLYEIPFSTMIKV